MEATAKKAQMDYVTIKDAAKILKVVNHKLRIKILALLDEGKQLMVTDIQVKLRLTQSVTSLHLSILREANIVTAERKSKAMYYSLNYGRISDIQTIVAKFAIVIQPSAN